MVNKNTWGVKKYGANQKQCKMFLKNIALDKETVQRKGYGTCTVDKFSSKSHIHYYRAWLPLFRERSSASSYSGLMAGQT